MTLPDLVAVDRWSSLAAPCRWRWPGHHQNTTKRIPYNDEIDYDRLDLLLNIYSPNIILYIYIYIYTSIYYVYTCKLKWSGSYGNHSRTKLSHQNQKPKIPLFVSLLRSTAGIYCISNASKKATVSSLTFPPLHTQEGTSTHDKHESIQTCIKGCSFGDRFPKRSRQALYDDQPNIHFHVLQLHRHFLCTMHHAAVWWNALSVQPEQLAVCCKDWGMFSLGRVFIPGYDRYVYVKPESLNANSPSRLGF